MNGGSLNIKEDNLQKLQQLFPDVFTEDKIDWEKLKATFSDDINFINERYVLNWAGKADAFTNPASKGSEEQNMLYELMIKAGYQFTDNVEAIDKFYSVNDGELIIALAEMSQSIIDKIISSKPQKVITLDNLFTGNDQLKTNTVLQMRDARVEFKTI
ncbi:MAG: hypothetical protein ABIO55_13865 [Ginsengibacter sp.]